MGDDDEDGGDADDRGDGAENWGKAGGEWVRAKTRSCQTAHKPWFGNPPAALC